MVAPRQIGQDSQTRMLWEISKQLDQLIKITSKLVPATTTTTTTVAATTTTTTTGV